MSFAHAVVVMMLGAAGADEAAAPAQRYIDANARSDAAKLSEAFVPAALMYWVDKDGHVVSRTQADWRARMTAADPKLHFRQSIAAVDRDGDAAVVTATGTLDGKPITDFLLTMKIGTQWRAVGKVFSRAPLPKRTDPAAAQAIREVVAAKLRSDTSFRGAELLATQHARAVFFNLDLDQLVIASAQEWAARFDQRRREGSDLKPLKQEIDAVSAAGDVGYARWTVRWSSGRTITDYSLLVREQGQWRMVNTAYVASATP